ncbi:MAG: translation initiation factor IF-2 [Clostridiales bacterium]|nr:translation initiation factor IF-2 [Clostridiales bacterium]
MADMERKKSMGNTETTDAAKERTAQGDRQAKMKEDEPMQKNQDPEAVKKTEEKTAEKTDKKTAGPAKKKNIIQVFRPQNSKTGMVKPGSRPRPQGAAGARGPASASRPQSGTGVRPAGKGPVGTRPHGAASAAAGTRPQGTATGVKSQTVGNTTAGIKNQDVVNNTATGVKPQSTSRTAAAPKPQSSVNASVGMKPQAFVGESNGTTGGEAVNVTAKPQTMAGTSSGARSQNAAGTKSQSSNSSAVGTKTQGNAGGSAGTRNQNTSARGSQSGTRQGNEHRSQSSYGRNQENRSTQGSYGRNQDGRGSQGGYGRNQESRGTQSGYGRNQDGRSGQSGYGRNSENRGGQGNRGMSIPKPSGDTKPLEKESRKRTERGDRNRADKGEKLDRMEKNVRPGQKNNQRSNQKNTGKRGQAAKAPAPKPVEKPQDTIRTITLPDKMTISELAEAMKVQPSAIVKKLFLQGTMVTVNQEVDFDKAEEIALEFNCICEKEEKVDVIAELLKEEDEAEDKMISRPPVVCVMGHVDHGKTSLLDTIRHTHVIDKEAGGITQHIGAYVVSVNGQKITFLDTPGHEAFTAMRMRGANSTDIAILVVAADDGVMPQTIEAINHAKAAGIEIIVAINKIDKPSANIERVKQELSEYELIPEDWGGSTVVVPVSAHTHEGIDNLLEMILLTAEVLELKANPNRKARGLVIEAELDKGKGPVATVLVQKGTLHVGDPIAAGSCHGKVRAMMDDKGRRVKQAGPSTPVEILGLSDVPNAGEIFICMDSEKEARSFSETFISEGRERMIEDTKMRMSLDDLYSQIQAGKLKELDLIVKADVQGSVEAVKQSLLKLSNEEVVVKVIHSGVGAINESDVILASASNAIIIGFNIRPDAMAKATAEREGVDVRLYRVIYDAIADVESAMKGMLDPIFEEKVIGHAEIRQLFKASGVGTIAGSYVTDGVFQRNCQVRITREGSQIYEGSLASLKRFKDDVKEVKAGYECGLVFEKFNDIKEEDRVEAYVMVEVPR